MSDCLPKMYPFQLFLIDVVGKEHTRNDYKC